MSGTSAVAVKRAIVAKLDAVPALGGDTDVQVGYGPPTREGIERRVVYLGRVTFNHRPMAFKAAAGRLQRDEQGTASVHIFVCLPGSTEEDAEDAAQVLGTAVEEAIASDPRLGGALLVTVSGGELDAWTDDDAAYAGLTYRVAFRSQLT
ncbi:hypothetical protein [Actinomadura sp. HBU206391]|uniref:hypothetical protein n=1 Tax=Actinomadura sp. HBU206391 TaxID=2731692 RepID=UPI00164F43C9|nr:hypothetical protein [Actinomadura sp. HBU206391]MBC6458421.1 hypothetical protein [Actinomadura sp. HBU206391]